MKCVTDMRPGPRVKETKETWLCYQGDCNQDRCVRSLPAVWGVERTRGDEATVNCGGNKKRLKPKKCTHVLYLKCHFNPMLGCQPPVL